jgi:PIN domain nuclease of toxin-antitoxin system
MLWVLAENPKLSRAARAAIEDDANHLLISSVSAFEITTKYRLGKLPEFAAIAQDFPAILAEREHDPLPVSMAHAALAGALDHPHKDPFDRLLIAQAKIERVPIVSNEALFDEFGVERIW